ncbi:WRKY DNA-binding protein 14 [Tasmannia lanceolata]|uniref:WRKY DNA-binding protein 14 n=1 Tax=Tasmannia lanceolata TaxID=3420 RepID=UPI0040645926
MCSFFWQRMENDQGDLADIVRASGGGNVTTNNPAIDWQFPIESTDFPVGIVEPIEDFGDPFASLRDPLLHELDVAGSAFFNRSNSSGLVKMSVEKDDNFLTQKILGEEIKRPCNIFSKMLQISPSVSPTASAAVLASPRGIKPSLDGKEMIRANSSVNFPVDAGGVQISSPRNPGIKRRKSQAKKVVCIPAPAAANSRSSGEVVPSDLWAWRKYGQKPIKGSPYPRGYYRCSSSKGCSARKQVERSRTDPNMLVITYTSEHNHPWPTQRNALAGSTRSQPIKNNLASKSSPASHTSKFTNLKEEPKENNSDNASAVIADRSIGTIKEEASEIEKSMDTDDNREFDQGFGHSYTPVPPDSNQSDDFFADLGELEPDPLTLMFPQGFTGDKSEEGRENKALDPFNLFDWSGNSFGEAKRGL